MMMQDRKVNQKIARDLVSNAGSARHENIANMNDFNNYDHNSTFKAGKAALDRVAGNTNLDSDLRSLKSEFDYGSKRKFVDVLGNQSRSTQLNKLRKEL